MFCFHSVFNTKYDIEKKLKKKKNRGFSYRITIFLSPENIFLSPNNHDGVYGEKKKNIGQFTPYAIFSLKGFYSAHHISRSKTSFTFFFFSNLFSVRTKKTEISC